MHKSHIDYLGAAQGDLYQTLNDKDLNKHGRDFLIFQATSTLKAFDHRDIVELIESGKIQEAIDALEGMITDEIKKPRMMG